MMPLGQLIVPSETCLGIMAGVSGSVEFETVRSKVIDWGELERQLSPYEMTLGDIESFRAALVPDPAAMLQRIFKQRGLMLLGDVNGVAQELLAACDAVIVRLSQANLAEFVMGAIIVSGRILNVVRGMIDVAAERQLDFPTSAADELTTWAVGLGGIDATDEKNALQFIAWVSSESRRIARLERSLLAQLKLRREAEQFAQQQQLAESEQEADEQSEETNETNLSELNPLEYHMLRMSGDKPH